MITDGWQGYRGFESSATSMIAAASAPPVPEGRMPVSRYCRPSGASLAKRWLLGTYQGYADDAGLTDYLNEFVSASTATAPAAEAALRPGDRVRRRPRPGPLQGPHRRSDAEEDATGSAGRLGTSNDLGAPASELSVENPLTSNYSQPVISGDPLTGRDSELGVIRRALSGVGKYSGVVIVGAAGVGKTRLAREVLARAEASGERTCWIVGTHSARQLPLGAFTASICDSISDPISDVRRVINSFIAQQRQGRLLIGIDDAHLLDALSAHVVHQLAQARGTRLVVTVRTGGDEPDAITALWKDDLLARLDLEPLSASDIHRMIETTLGGAVDSRSAKRFWKLTGGNALFLRQLLKDQIAVGAIRQVAGVWMWDERVAVSDSIGDMVGRQLSRLAPDVALVVDTLSQYEPLAVDALCDLVHRRDLEAAEQMNLVTVERSGSKLMARLAHPLFGELRRGAASEMYLSRIRGKLAQRLAKDADADMHATVRRALLALESDLPPTRTYTCRRRGSR